MQPIHDFCDDCHGCRPALVDAETGKPLASDSPTMIRVNAVWDHETTYSERKAFIDVTCNRTQAPDAMALCESVMRKVQAAMMSRPS